MASCTHNCILCPGKSPWTEKESLMTVADLHDNYEAFIASGGKKADASKYKNVVNRPLITVSDDVLLISCIGIPELHINTGLGAVADLGYYFCGSLTIVAPDLLYFYFCIYELSVIKFISLLIILLFLEWAMPPGPFLKSATA